MTIDLKNLIAIMGFHVAGDFGPLTIYTNKKGKRVFFPRSPPKEPPSNAQQFQRSKFRVAAMDWKELTSTNRAKWELIAQRTYIPMTGYNLFLACELTYYARSILPTLVRQAKLSSTPPFIARSS